MKEDANRAIEIKNEESVGGRKIAVKHALHRAPLEQRRAKATEGLQRIRLSSCLERLLLMLLYVLRVCWIFQRRLIRLLWASRLGREHHDDLARFMLGMGYATEALYLPGISKRLEFDLAMQSNDLKRALQFLLTMSNNRDIGQDSLALDLNDILNLSSKKEKKENVFDAVQGIVKFAKDFMDLIDAADATAQADIAREALKRLAAAGSVKGALQGNELRGLALRLANHGELTRWLALCLAKHGELTRLSTTVNNFISVGLGREAAFTIALF